jgi:ketol-acid reductoisomerase
MDWMYANCSTTAQRGALDWKGPFRDAVRRSSSDLYQSVSPAKKPASCWSQQLRPDYREKLEEELKAMRESEMWQAGAAVRSLRPENWETRNHVPVYLCTCLPTYHRKRFSWSNYVKILIPPCATASNPPARR